MPRPGRLMIIGVWTAMFTLLVGCAGTQRGDDRPVAQLTGSRLYDGIDRYHFPITTSSTAAQQWFDQGLQLAYGFNHGEAIRSFTEATACDPDAPMPWWGIAYAHGMNINDAMVTEDRWKASHEAIENARARLDGASDLERALVEAVAARCAWPVPEAQRPYDESYAAAMAEVHSRFPSNPDVGVLYAESLMNLQPWAYWDADLQPVQATSEFVHVLEGVLAMHPDHPQACHLYIHAMEAGPDPARAEAAADRLLHRIPGAGHLVHMPSHLYARVGRYADATDANILAVEADRILMAQGTEPGMYWVYFAHNLHFWAFGSMMEGRYEPAIEAARELEFAIPEDNLKAFAFLIEGIIPTKYHVMIRFGRWDEVLRQSLPAEHRLMSRATHYYARGIALSALGRTDEARREIEQFESAVALVPGEWRVFANSVNDILPVARAMLEGELAYREGRLDDAWRALRRGIEAEDALIYDEPPGWMVPVRHAMGALLMEAGDYAQAERLYREDQEIHPGNGWSLLGLQQSLTAQGRHDEAAAITPRLDAAWARVETRPTSSCLCAPSPLAVAP